MVAYLVCMKKRTKSEQQEFFVCTKLRSAEFLPACFHGIGYRHSEKEGPIDESIVKNEEELWIPWDNISYVKSLIYQPR